jgi:hypothetical protein
MVRPNHALTPPQIRPQVSYSLHQADELTLVGGQFGVARRDLSSEEREWSAALMEHRAKACAESVALHDERRQLQDRCFCEGVLKGAKRRLHLQRPPEHVRP